MKWNKLYYEPTAYGRKVSPSGGPVGGVGEELRGNLRRSMEVPGATCCL